MTVSGIRSIHMSSVANPETRPVPVAPPTPKKSVSGSPSTRAGNQPQPQTPPPPQPQSQPQRDPSVAACGAQTGDQLGDYVLGETIGQGTFGKVKIGLHMLTGERVAVKILEKARIVEPADVERVAREIRILQRNRHVNVVQLFEVIDAPERIFLIMEHADSGEMFEYIVAHHRIREPEAAGLFRQIVDGLEYLHANEITHRDLKPENLLLQSTTTKTSSRGGSSSNSKGNTPFLVKIVDFGLSNTHDGGRLLRTACGSPCYAAPEMIQGKAYVGPVADIWSLGVVLFAMICGFLPYEDSNTNLLYKKILSADYKLPSFLSHAAQDLVRRIFETNPDKRASLATIRQHPWLASAASVPRAMISVVHHEDERMRTRILDQLATVGLPPDAVLAAVQQQTHNRLTAAYFLLYNKLARVLTDRQQHSLSQPQSQSQPQASSAKPQSQSHSPSRHRQRSHSTHQGTGPPGPQHPQLEPDVNGSREPVPVKATSSSASAVSSAVHSRSGSGRSTTAIVATGRRRTDHAPGNGATTVVPSTSSTTRRPHSNRGGRHLVFLTNGGGGANGGAAPRTASAIRSSVSSSSTSSSSTVSYGSNSSIMGADGVAASTSTPTPTPPPSRPPSQGGVRHGHSHGHSPSHNQDQHHPRVSISNGMVALTPLFSGQTVRLPKREITTPSPRSAPRGRRHTATVTSIATSSVDAGAGAVMLLPRRRGSTHSTSSYVASTPTPSASTSSAVVAQRPTTASLKEDDTRQSTPTRIPHRPQPPPSSSSTANNSNKALAQLTAIL